MPRAVFDIFLSSTSEDLQECRAKVKEMIARMRQAAIRMETFGARPTKPFATCREEVRKCDALIVIVGHRYGWVPTEEDGGDGMRSITWWEVEWALDAGKPVYAFLVDPRAPWCGEREQDRLMTATTERMAVEVGRAVRHLLEFRAFLDAKATRELFTSADDLAGKVATSLHHWLLEQLPWRLGSGNGRPAAARASSWPEPPLPLQWSMADHGPVRDAFETLIRGRPPWRFLPVRGPSELGKSHISRQMLAIALRVAGLNCGRFDFKGTTDMDAELGAFVLHLGVGLPRTGALNDRLGQILAALRRRAQPALLVFDTYESAGEAQYWVEKQLLTCLIRATWLRVIIIGQRVPDSAGATWEGIASPSIVLKPPLPQDWFEYGKSYRPELTLAEVESVYTSAQNKPSLLAQFVRRQA